VRQGAERKSHFGARRTAVQLRRGAHLIPSLLTTGNLFAGYGSMVLSIKGQFETAALLIGVAALLDALDGRVARMTGTTSAFGKEFDSLADVISFGVAPAILAWSWALSDFGRLGWAVSFLFVVCNAIRLARFNVQSGTMDKRYFVGLPVPPAACAIAACAFIHPQSLEDQILKVLSLVLVISLALLMVSKMRYRSFKDLDLRARRPYVWVVAFAVVLALVAAHPQIFLLVAAFAYVLSAFVPRRAGAARSGAVSDAQRTAGGRDGS
jgi:CDP-diacylglycerol--serine O-phosphatidyltransferase